MSVYIELWNGDNFTSNVQWFNKVGSYPKLNHDISGDCNSYKVSAGTWAILYEKSYFKGLSIVVGSETEFLEEPYLSRVSRNDHQGTNGLNWNNDIGSIRVFDHKPNNVDLILAKFLDQYQDVYEKGHEIEWDNNYYYYKHLMQGCEYKMHYPKIAQRTISNDIIEFSIHFKHIVDLNDEEAILHFAMDKDGGFVEKVTVTYDNGIFQFPDWFISLADFTIDQMANVVSKAICKLENKIYSGKAVQETKDIVAESTDLAENIEEDGEDKNMDFLNKVTDKIIQAGAKCATFCIDHVNQVISEIASYIKQKDGGSLYFSTVISHALVRLINAYTEVITENDSIENTSTLNINNQTIATALDSSWSNKKAQFECETKQYTVHQPDVTFGFNKISLYCSAKINDYENNENHVALNMITDPSGELTFIQGSMYIHSFEYDSDNAPNSGMISKHDDGFCYQIYRKGSHDNTFQAIENQVLDDQNQPVSDLIDAYKICLQRSLKNCADNYGHTLGNSILTMPSASSKVADAIMQGISM